VAYLRDRGQTVSVVGHDIVRALTLDDVPWMVELMAQRRARYERLSLVFWRPAAKARDVHEQYLASCVDNDRFCGLRTDSAFLLADAQGAGTPPWWSDVPTGFVDDFAVTTDDQWATHGAELLRAAFDRMRPVGTEALRVVTARRDAPKVGMLESLGLTIGESWWVTEARGERAPDPSFGPVAHDGFTALVVPAPPVYDPGGPVLLTLAVDDVALVSELPTIAARTGTVLVIVSTKPSTPEVTAVAQAAGFDEVSQYYLGVPSR
jgi:hypothetical protein